MSHLTKGQEFIKTLEKEVKRLSPTLNLSSNNLDPYSQIVYIVRVAIDTLLEEKRSLTSEYLKLNDESIPYSSASDQGESAEAKNKLVEAQKELKKYERLVRQKEKKLEDREREFEKQLNSFKGADSSIGQEMKLLKSKNKELDGKIKALHDKEGELKQGIEKLNKERSHFEGEKLAVFHMKSQMQQNYAESERLKELSSVGYENIRRETERISLEDKFLKDREEALNLRQEYIEKSLTDLEKRKKAFEDEKSKFRLEKNPTIKQGINDQFSLSDEKSKYVDSRSQTLKNLPEASGLNTNKDLDLLFGRVKEQMEIYNQEVQTREMIIEEKRSKLRVDQEKLRIIVRYLFSVKDEILQFRGNIMEEFENMLKKMRVQFELFSRKLTELEKFQLKIADRTLKNN